MVLGPPVPPAARCLSGPFSLAVGILACLAPGCDFPTELPAWETEWAFAGEHIRIDVADLLPEGIDVLPDGSAFRLSSVEGRVEWRLGDQCPECAIVHGLVVPKPAFTADEVVPLELPPEVVQVSVLGGWVDVEILHGLGFDPIRPGAGVVGRLDLRVREGSEPPILDVRYDGAERGLASGRPHADSFPLGAGVMGRGLGAPTRLESPAGDPVRIDADARFALRAILRDVRLDRIRVRPGSRSFLLDETISLGEVGPELLERMNRGVVTLTVENPFDASFRMDLVLVGGDGTRFERDLRVPPGSAEAALAFSGPEIRSLMASDAMRIEGIGRLEDPAAELELRPDQTLELESVVTLRLHTGARP